MSNRQIGPVAKELIAAKARIADPENWCQGKFQDGHRVCAAGAFGLTGGWAKRPIPPAVKLLNDASDELYGRSCIGTINDDNGHQAVMRCFDHAIQRALSEGK